MLTKQNPNSKSKLLSLLSINTTQSSEIVSVSPYKDFGTLIDYLSFFASYSANPENEATMLLKLKQFIFLPLLRDQKGDFLFYVLSLDHITRF